MFLAEARHYLFPGNTRQHYMEDTVCLSSGKARFPSSAKASSDVLKKGQPQPHTLALSFLMKWWISNIVSLRRLVCTFV